MKVYDEVGNLIGYVRESDVSSKPLENTAQVGDRKREQWLKDIAARSQSQNWNTVKLKQIVTQEVKSSPYLLTEKSRYSAISEGKLAADPDVRDEFGRLQNLRDECWERDRDYLRRVKHGPHQLLVDILRRQSRISERMHTQDADLYLTFMHREYGE